VYGLEKEYGSRIHFVRVNILIKDNQPLMEQYGFSTTPEIYLVDGSGKILAVWDDTLTEESMRQAFDAALAQGS